MTAMQNSQYLESRVLTAPPQRLHLILIEGAIRFGRQAEALLRRNEIIAAEPPLMRAIDIAGELLVAARQNRSEITDKLAAFYGYLFRALATVKVNSDADLLAETLELLEFDRQTWQMVCEKLAAEPTVSAVHSAGAPISKPQRAIIAPLQNGSGALSSNSGISLEA